MARNSPEGVLSAPADDSFLGDCDPKAVLFYGPGYKNEFDAATQKSVAYNLIDGNPFAQDFNIISAFGGVLKDLQIRVVYLDSAGGSYAFRDFQLTGTTIDRNELHVEYDHPASGSRIEVYYIPGVKTPSSDPDKAACRYPKTDNFSEGWTPLNSTQFEEMTKKNYKAFLAAFDILVYQKLDRPDLPDIGEVSLPK